MDGNTQIRHVRQNRIVCSVLSAALAKVEKSHFHIHSKRHLMHEKQTILAHAEIFKQIFSPLVLFFLIE